MGKRTNTAVWLEKYNRWQIKVQKDGERRTFTSSTPGRTGQREANKKADEWLDDGIVHSNKRLRDYMDEWLEEVKQTTSYSNHRQYNAYAKNWIKPKIGNIKMGDLTDGHLQSVINNAYAKGKLAKKTLSNIRSCLTAFVKFSRKYKACTLIPVDLKIPAGAAVGEREILQPSDVIKLFTVSTTRLYNKDVPEPFINAFRLEVATGLRPGETIGLKWSDLSESKINVKRSINIFKEETQGKNKNARRSFTQTPLTVDILGKQLEFHNKNNITSDWVFTDIYGDRVNPSTYRHRWERYRDCNGMTTQTTLYELRHTFVSIVKSLPEGYLKQLVGHSADMDTYGVYSHELAGDADQAAILVQKTFVNILNPQSGGDKK
ncbi:MAG: tyrosine-type recombinase/integrase [Eubacteriales bacterium]